MEMTIEGVVDILMGHLHQYQMEGMVNRVLQLFQWYDPSPNEIYQKKIY